MNREKYDSYILGRDEKCVVSTNCYETQLNNNVLVIGGSGSGKTSGVVNPIILHLQHGNAVVVYTKMGIMQEAAEALKEKGYTIDVIDFVNAGASQTGYDPLAYCRTEEDVNCLVRSITEATVKTDRDPFWQNAADEILGVVFRNVWNGNLNRPNCLEEVLLLLREIKHYPKDYWKRYFEDKFGSFTSWDNLDDNQLRKLQKDYPMEGEMYRLKKLSPDDYKIWENFRDMTAESTKSCILATIRVAMDGIFTDATKKIISNRKTFDLKNLLEPQRVLFIYVSPVNMAQHKLVNIFYGQIFKGLFEMAEERPERVLPYPVHIICDDFATGCPVANFPEMISVFREKRISAILLVQSESQLRQLYGINGATTIINNCDTMIYMGGMDLGTCQDISLRCNVPLEEIMYMPIGTEYFIRRGQKPVRTERYNYLQDDVYLSLKARNSCSEELSANIS